MTRGWAGNSGCLWDNDAELLIDPPQEGVGLRGGVTDQVKVVQVQGPYHDPAVILLLDILNLYCQAVCIIVPHPLVSVRNVGRLLLRNVVFLGSLGDLLANLKVGQEASFSCVVPCVSFPLAGAPTPLL